MRDFRLYLDDIQDAIAQIRSYVHGMNQEDFVVDRKTQDGVVRNLEQLYYPQYHSGFLYYKRTGALQGIWLKRSQSDLVSGVAKLIDDVERLYHKETRELPRLHFDRHLYQPLLIEYDDDVKMTPPGLNKSEKKFVHDVRDYWVTEKDALLAGMEVFLLRNLSRGTGIGFFVERGFYPDFILWIKKRSSQHVIFIEPHGMLHEKAYTHDDKARLYEALPGLAKDISARSRLRRDVTLDSYIISATPFKDLRKRYDDGTWGKKKFADAHILFQERSGEYDYMKTIFLSQAIG